MDDSYKEEESINKSPLRIDVASNETPRILGNEDIGSFIEHLNHLIIQFLEFAGKPITEECISLANTITEMVGRLITNEKPNNFKNCVSFFNSYFVSQYIHVVSAFIELIENQDIYSMIKNLIELASRITVRDDINFDDILSYPIIEALHEIISKDPPFELLAYSLLFIRNMLDIDKLFDAFSETFTINFFDEMFEKIGESKQNEKEMLLRGIVLSLYTFTKHKQTKEDADLLFNVLMKTIPFISKMPDVIGYFSYALTNQIYAETFNFENLENTSVVDELGKMLEAFDKPYKELTKEEQESLGNVLSFFAYAADNGYEVFNFENAFLFDVMRNGDESLFRSASLILQEQMYKSYDYAYIADVLAFFIELYNSSTMKKLGISLFLCDIIESSNDVIYEDLFNQDIFDIIISTLSLDLVSKENACMVAHAIQKLNDIAKEIGKEDEWNQYIQDNIDELNEFCENYEDEEPGCVVQKIIDDITQDDDDGD